ncbi:hypothetical protein SAMN05421640_3773 [Ekhidna lutea]|uniref:Ankyrin repeat-containing protein n=1 Tax=Ekhidna lutea TaxID=447679 RepID=A0A239MCJ6_EKHLU|nr:hypothetical protein [Ekhidna lutea]SNT39873.1 hypothetical protein SAMN05421640_3773 [Ekhidna lutea]
MDQNVLDMKNENLISRRKILKGSALGIVGLSLPFTTSASIFEKDHPSIGKPYPAYPSLEPELVSEVVGKSHFDLDTVKKLVDKRPELARATWEWRFGDFESAIGAASHVGRRDIIHYLLSKGATPDIFTFATLGAFETVKGIIQLSPGIQASLGPHGISLLSHAKVGLRMEDKMSTQEVDNCKKLIDYLEDLGDADGPSYEEVPESEKPKYLGDYKYGEGEKEGFSIQLNMRKLLSLGAIGEFGGALYKTGKNQFNYSGAPSIKVTFQFDGDQVKSLTVKDPDREIVAKKI